MGEKILNANIIANNIKKLREESGWNQAQLAKESGVSPAAISLIEKAERTPSMLVTRKLASAFKVSIDELTGVQSKSSKDINKEAQIFFRNWHDLENLKEEDKAMIKGLIDRLKEQTNVDSGK